MSTALDMSASKLAPCVVGGVKFGSYLNCLIEVCESNGTGDFIQIIRKLDEMVPALYESYPEGIAFLVIVAPGAPIPNSADRKALEAFFTKWHSKWRAIARVAEGSDIRSIATRAVMTGLVLVKRAAHPENTFSTCEDAAEWLGQFLARRQGQDTQHAIAELTSAIQKVRSLAH